MVSRLVLNDAEEAQRMYKAASRKISIFLTGFILLACVAILPPSLCIAGMSELSDGEMATYYAAGFSSFDLNTTTGIARIDLNTLTLNTYTTIDSLKMGYYSRGALGWDNSWSSVSLGTAGTDLVFNGLYIEAKFQNYNNPATRELDYLRIGTSDLTGTVNATFNSFSGEVGGASYTRQNLGAGTITSTGADKGFYMELSSANGFRFHFGTTSTISP
jgi:hypothetical protein